MAKKQESAAAAAQGAAAVEARREALLDAEARGSPVLTLIAKRLRAAKKKVKKVEEIEAIKASGRDINADQEEVLKGKTRNLANIEELERLFPLLREAASEEVSQKLSAKAEEIEAAASLAAAAKVAEEAKAAAEANEVEKAKANALAEDLKAKLQDAAENSAALETKRAEEKAAEEAKLIELQNAEKTGLEEAVMRLLQLIYFSKLFSKEAHPDVDYLPQMERDACLSYNSTVSFVGEALTAHDLDAICAFGKLISTRQGSVSHQDALERCRALALDWVNATETHIPELSMTVNELVVKFERITGSAYYSIKPEVKGAHEVVSSAGFRPEGSIPTPPGRDVGANSYSSSAGSYPSVAHHQQSLPASSNNDALHQLLAPRTTQMTGEGQPAVEQDMPNGFVPTLSSGFTQPISSGFTSAGSTPASFGTHTQPPGFEPHTQKAHSSDTNGPASQYMGAVFQGKGGFNGLSGSESAGLPGSNGPSQFFTPPDAAAAAADASTAPAQQVPEDVGGLLETKAPERKDSYHAPAGVRPRAQPMDGSRGRVPGRGRGGPGRQGGENPQRGSGRRGGPGRGGGLYRGGRGRDFPPQYNQQQVFQQAGGY